MAFKERLFERSPCSWTWHFAKESDWTALAPSPERMDAASTLVKQNPLRKVFRRDSYFIKIEEPKPQFGLSWLKSVFAPKAKSEFDSLLALCDAGVKAVEPVAYGSAGAAQGLITRAFEGSISVSDYYYSEFSYGSRCPDAFLKSWAAFIKRFIASGFLHPDFHNGNILYQPFSGDFCLVDVFGVKRAGGLSTAERESMLRIVFEMRCGLSPAQLAVLAADCGAEGDPLNYVERGLEQEARRLAAEWPKRKRQLLEGYGKFVRKTVDSQGRELWLLLDKARRPMASAEELEPGRFEVVENGIEDMLAAFRLELALLPHRRAVAWRPETGAAFFERTEPSGAVSNEELASLGFYAARFGIDLEGVKLGRDSSGRLLICDCAFGPLLQKGVRAQSATSPRI